MQKQPSKPEGKSIYQRNIEWQQAAKAKTNLEKEKKEAL